MRWFLRFTVSSSRRGSVQASVSIGVSGGLGQRQGCHERQAGLALPRRAGPPRHQPRRAGDSRRAGPSQEAHLRRRHARRRGTTDRAHVRGSDVRNQPRQHLQRSRSRPGWGCAGSCSPRRRRPTGSASPWANGPRCTCRSMRPPHGPRGRLRDVEGRWRGDGALLPGQHRADVDGLRINNVIEPHEYAEKSSRLHRRPRRGPDGAVLPGLAERWRTPVPALRSAPTSGVCPATGGHSLARGSGYSSVRG